MTTRMMRALQAIVPGDLKVVYVPMPDVRRGEVLVEVLCSALNGMDADVLDGQWGRYARRWSKQGVTLTGFEFSGVARSDGVSIRAGQRVIGYSHVLHGQRTHCQFVAMPECDLQPFPERLSFEEAAALVVGGLTSIQILERIRPLRIGQRCLIVGANGAVGLCCVQLALSQGAQVVALAAPQHFEALRGMGVHELLDSRDQRAWKSISAFDLIIDTPPLMRYAQARHMLADNGTYVTSHPEQDLLAPLRSLLSTRKAGWLMLLRGNRELFQRLAKLAEQTVLRPSVDSVFTLDEAAQAFVRVRCSGIFGRVLLRMT
ncbi:NADP-dependent oxidoreductase [Pseudomonas monteilii]|uniref:NADP-dependent oxidoreductase n=1 Tax=Pseudomonas monteilii TaxID=76759 RepID=A0A399M914_9PSED|nr:NADP-dependent oxidoreductase [Pseudomonas monteilii]RII78261.1 NADP-dependent oxidoreductase [Pseudomonas monteilii]